MEYHRIHKPSPQSGGGLSPSKLRAMLLGLERSSRNIDDDDVDVDVDMFSSSTAKPPAIATATAEDDSSSGDAESVSSGFEFQRAQQHHRNLLLSPFLKPAPSKWDDAQKWIASPTANRPGGGGDKPQVKMAAAAVVYNKQLVAKIVEEVHTNRNVHRKEGKEEVGLQKLVNRPAAATDVRPVVDSGAKPALAVETSVGDSAVILSQHDSTASYYGSSTNVTPPSAGNPVSMRDMGTEMTPIASQEPSRTGTPARSTTPTRSRTNSRSQTPERTARSSTINHSADLHVDTKEKQLTENELQLQTRREIIALGAQLGKTNIAAWASKEMEKGDVPVASKSVPEDQPSKNDVEARAATWEEVEKTKYLARFQREEIKIQAWENHQKAKIEAEMRKIEVEVEKMRARAQEKQMNKVTAARHKVEEKRAAAEAKRIQQAAKTAQQVEYIRTTGRIPSSFSCWSWCS